MPVISVLNQKGGSGKTTFATHLAKGLERRGKSVLLVDSDPQGSARDWAAADPEQTLSVVGLDRETLERDIQPVAKATEYIVIDGAPRHEKIMGASLRVSDLVLIPVQPSPYDIWAAADLVETIHERHRNFGPLKPRAAFVLSRVIKRTKIGTDVRGALDEMSLPVLAAHTVQRVTYPNSAAVGKTVFDLDPLGEAGKEMDAVVDEVLALLEAN